MITYFFVAPKLEPNKTPFPVVFLCQLAFIHSLNVALTIHILKVLIRVNRELARI